VITADIARQVAERAGVKSVLIGNFIKAGDTIRISVRLQDARTSRIHSAERVEGIGDGSVFTIIDDLTRRIRSKVDLLRGTPPPGLLAQPGAGGATTRTGVDRGLTDITTASIDAYRYYAQGIDLHERSLEAQAIPLFEKALSIDPGFAMAMIKLAVAESNAGDGAKSRGYAKRALDEVDRLTPRERYYIEGFYYSGRVDTIGRSIEASTKAVTLYPDHQSARHNLALIYLNLERLPECIAQYEELRRRGAVFPATHGNLAWCYVRSGQVDQALAVMQEYVRVHPEVSAGHRNLGTALMAAGRLDEAMAAVAKADALEPGAQPTAQTRWFLLAFSGQWPEADSVAGKMAAPSTNAYQQWLGLVDLATASLYRGQTAAALALVDRAVRVKGLSAGWRATSRAFAGSTFLDLSKSADALSQGQAGMPDAENRTAEFDMFRVIAAAQAGLGRQADAEATLARLKQQADLLPGNAQQRTVHWASGEVALARGDAAAAIAEFEQAQTMLPPHGGSGGGRRMSPSGSHWPRRTAPPARMPKRPAGFSASPTAATSTSTHRFSTSGASISSARSLSNKGPSRKPASTISDSSVTGRTATSTATASPKPSARSAPHVQPGDWLTDRFEVLRPLGDGRPRCRARGTGEHLACSLYCRLTHSMCPRIMWQ